MLLRIAGIDIGTNTLLMVIGEVDKDKNITWIRDYHEIARLGEGVDSTNIINEQSIARAENILTKYKAEIDELKVGKTIIVGTSALRDAQNSKEVKSKLEKIIGAEISIISGNEEALLTFLGTVESNSTAAVIDIGGGSTEFILANQSEILSATSLNIGAVRITERFNLNENLDKLAEAESFLDDEFNKLSIADWDVDSFSVAGTPVTLAMIKHKMNIFDRDKIHSSILTLNDINVVIETIKNTDKDILVEQFSVNPNRADIILGGALILKHYTARIPRKEVIVSCNGLRYGVVKKYINKQKI